MKQILQKRIFPVLVCLVFIASMALPVAAADDDAVISLAEPSRIFNDDGTVTVTYDLPLSPYSVIYGLPINSSEFVQVGTSTNIYFTQEKDETISVFTSLYSSNILPDAGFSYNESLHRYICRLPGSTQYFNPILVTHMLLNDVTYPAVFWQDKYGSSFFDTDNTGTATFVPGRYWVYCLPDFTNPENSPLEFNFASYDIFSGSVSLGYYEDVMISQHEYDALYPLLFPFGRTNYIDVSNIRSGGSFEVSVTYDYNIILHGTDTTTDLIQHIDFYDKNFRLISTTSSVTTPFDVANGASSTIDTTVTVPEGACYMDMELTTDPFAVSDVQLLDWRVSDMEMTFDMSDVEANSLMMSGIIERLDKLVDEALETNESLDEIIDLLQQIIADQSSNGCDHTEIVELLERITGNQDLELTWLEKIWQAIISLTDKISTGVQSSLDQIETTVDNILTGGDAGDDLIAGGDVIEDAGSGLQEDLDQIQDFEDQYMADFDNNMDEIAAAVDLTTLTAPLNFVWGYTNKAVAAVPSQYLVVFTLPALIGIFLFIIGHPVRAPRPDTSGDQVTRETFTETTILTGKHAGETRSTRTVTTTHEIGRVRNE